MQAAKDTVNSVIGNTTGQHTSSGGEKHPGEEHRMQPKPQVIRDNYKGADKLKGKVAIITGGDSGIGRAVAVHFAREGATGIAIAYLDEDTDAEETMAMIQKEGARAITIRGDVGDPAHARTIVDKTLEAFGKIDVLVNNAAEQHVQEDFNSIKPDQLERTFRTNIFGYFYMAQAALEHMQEGACIINTTSVAGYKGSGMLVDYSSTKGAITSFTRALSQKLAEKNIRVNGVAPGPIWTPFIPSTFPDDMLKEFGQQVPMKRAGQPSEMAPSYVFLASEDSSYFTGQVLHPNGGSVVNA